MIIVAGTAENGLASGIAKKLDAECVRVEKRLFPDGEFAIRFPKKLDGEEIAIVQSTYAPQGEHMLELLLMADELRSMGAKRITAVIPFLAYMRQDKRFRDGETISIATILHLLGFDHERLTYRFQGRDFRLTDVAGNVVQPILA